MSAPSRQPVIPPPPPPAPPPRARRTAPPRDQDKSTFTEILERLLAATPGAEAAALVDFEGETVDYTGNLDTFDIKIAAAHWQIVIAETAETPAIGAIRQMTLRARGRGYVVRRVQENYAVLLILHRRAAFTVSERALIEVEARLSIEAGWPGPSPESCWYGVTVQPEPRDRTRPSKMRVDGSWHPVDVMGTVRGLAPREKGFRVRLPSGAEMMLVRERLGGWFADERVD
ncbi:MAG: hypothetical protein ACMG6S_30125 [Byssovorax sp.]